MKIKVFQFENDDSGSIERAVNKWLEGWLEQGWPTIHRWLQTESSVYDLSSGDYPIMRTHTTITIVYG